MRKQISAAIYGLVCLMGSVSAFADGNRLTPEQTARLKKYIPRTYEKLDAREPVYTVVIGDSVTWGVSVIPGDPEHGNSHIGYPGVFLNQLAREFFYPGGVRLVNPPRGIVEKPRDDLGAEIMFENLARPGRCMIDGIQKLTTEAFVHDPDLVTINYGINDAVRRIPVDQYMKALQYLIDACKYYKSDVVVISPNLVKQGGGAITWGLTRPYAQAARDVAEANGVLFVDIGQDLSRWGGAIEDGTEPKVAMELVDDRLSRMMNWGPKMIGPEYLHPNHKAHEYIGLSIFEDLLNTPEKSDYTVTGSAEFVNEKQVKVSLSLRNQTGELRTGTIGALSWDGILNPEISEIDFILPAGKNKVIELIYNRPVVGKHEDGTEYYGPWSAADSDMRLTFVLIDGKKTQLLEPRGMKLIPVSVAWRNRFITTVSNSLRLEWNLVNGSQKPVNGTYRIGMGSVIAPAANFSLTPLGDKKFYATFPFLPPAGAARFQKNLFVEIEVDGKKFRFDRELEASKDLVLGKKVALSPYQQYTVGQPGVGLTDLNGRRGITLRAEADANALFLVYDLEGLELQDLGDQSALRAEFYIDGRPQNEVRSFGFVEPLHVYVPFRDGPGKTDNIQLGAFGNGYNMRLEATGITSVLKTVSASSRRLEIRIPRQYLFRHEWALGSPDSILGLRTVISLGRRNTQTGKVEYSKDSEYVLTDPELNLGEGHIAGIYYKNALSLQTLRLSPDPVDTWSIRIY